MQSEQQQSPTPEKILESYEKEEQAFQNHWLWKDLNGSPKEIFHRVNETLKKGQVDPAVWQKRLTEAREALQTRINEQRQRYQKVNLKMMRGIRA